MYTKTELLKILDFSKFKRDISKIITRKSKFTKNHEGIVVRSNDINKDNWSFKVKSREYQLRG